MLIHYIKITAGMSFTGLFPQYTDLKFVWVQS
jgi:hypothetical protein